MKKQQVDLNKLKELYETTDLSLTEIGNQLSISYDVLKNRIKKYNFIRPKHLVDSCERNRINKIKTTELGHKKQKNSNEKYQCSLCNSQFIPTKQQIVNSQNNKPIFCSIKCRNTYLNKNNKLKRPTLYCSICGKEVECTPDRFLRYNKGETRFYCSKSCVMKYSLNHMDLEQRSNNTRERFKDKQFVKNRTIKTQKTLMEKYGVTNFAKSEQFKEIIKLKRAEIIQKQKIAWQNMSSQTLQDIQHKKSINRKNNIATDGKTFDSKYELDVYEFCKRNEIPVETQIPIQFKHKGETHNLIIDFKIDGLLFECKGGHLLNGTFSDKLEVPIQEKIDVYKQNNVVIITDSLGSLNIPLRGSKETCGLKYLDKCPNPLIGVDIDLFRKPTFPFGKDKPECFYKVKVDGKKSPLEAWNDELLRWKMIINRINYVGGFITNKDILTAFNVTRTCKQPSWFNKNYAKKLIQKYITTDTIYDSFAGWGTRCDACKELGINYIGCDLNTELVDWHKSKNRNITLNDANNFKTNDYNCSVFICPPYTNYEQYFNGQDLTTTQCEWLQIVMNNIPNAKEYLMVCKVVDKGWERYIVEEKINKSHLGTNKEYVLLIKNKEK